MRKTEDIAVEAVAEIRKAAHTQDERRTPNARRAAELFLELRTRHDDPKGRGADMTGRSKEYRKLISSIYEAAFDGVPEDVQNRVTSQIRYHLSTAVREYLAQTPGSLELYGYNPKSVKERAADRVKQRRALLDMGLIDEATSKSSHVARLVHGARRLVQLASAEGFEYSDQEAREYARDGVAQIAQTIPPLMRDVDKVKVACNLLRQVDSSFAGGRSKEEIAELDQALVGAVDDATRLRTHTTTAEHTVEMIDELLERYAPTEARRKAM